MQIGDSIPNDFPGVRPSDRQLRLLDAKFAKPERVRTSKVKRTVANRWST